MHYTKTVMLILFVLLNALANAQIKITAFDFEAPLNVKDWWVDNPAVILSQCDQSDCDQLPGSRKCLRIAWNNVPPNKPYTWMTDIKIDTLGTTAMQRSWNSFKTNTWVSFKINTAGADSVYLQLIVFTKDEKDK